MIREKFEDIANQLGCKYEYSETRSVSFVSRNIPTSYHRVTLEYNSVNIDLVFEFGNHNLGQIKSIIKSEKNIPPFSVTTKSQIKRLFSKTEQPFIVESIDSVFQAEIVNFLETSMYNEIAQKTTFEPKICGVQNDGSYIINTNFYLGFKDKELSIIPSINLHKMIIDKILKGWS